MFKFETMEINATTKLMGGAVIVFVLFIPVVFLLFAQSNKQSTLEKGFQENFRGTVDSVYRDENNHNFLMAHLTGGTTYLINDEWKSDINVGDSLSKSIGSYLITVIKKDGKRTVLDYRILVKYWPN